MKNGYYARNWRARLLFAVLTAPRRRLQESCAWARQCRVAVYYDHLGHQKCSEPPRYGTKFATKSQRDAGLLEMVRSYGIEVASMDEFYSDRVSDELDACDAVIIVDDHYLDIAIPAEITP